jgi:hypothetical protein
MKAGQARSLQGNEFLAPQKRIADMTFSAAAKAEVRSQNRRKKKLMEFG